MVKPVRLRVPRGEILQDQAVKLTGIWLKQIEGLADARLYLQRLADAPRSEWRSEQRGEAIERIQRFERLANSINWQLERVERDLRLIERAAALKKKRRNGSSRPGQSFGA